MEIHVAPFSHSVAYKKIHCSRYAKRDVYVIFIQDFHTDARSQQTSRNTFHEFSEFKVVFD